MACMKSQVQSLMLSHLGTWEAEVGGCEFQASLKSETFSQKANEKLAAFPLVSICLLCDVGWSWWSRREQYSQRLDRRAGPCAQRPLLSDRLSTAPPLRTKVLWKTTGSKTSGKCPVLRPCKFILQNLSESVHWPLLKV